MKIQCDVCNKNEASLFCTADEAALCIACDHRVHHANKLASKHHRFSLHPPSLKQHPLCDICQERRAFVLCKQDRAILCKDCDSSIHSANEFTQKHDRFLLTGVKLSTTLPPNSISTFTSTTNASSDSSSKSISKSNPVAKIVIPSSPAASTLNNMQGSEGVSTTSSSLSKYLIETLPGWQVEDFLDSSSVPLGFNKSDDDDDDVFDADIEGNFDSFFPNNNMEGIWVPQAPSNVYTSKMMMGKNEAKEGSNIKGSNKSRLRDDSNFTVPQISPHSNSKRPRYLW